MPKPAALLGFAVALGAGAALALPVVTPGRPYAEVRRTLTTPANGHRPVRHDDPGRCGARTAICERYPETESCAGTGLAPCPVVFRNPRGGAQAVARVTTSGAAVEELVLSAIRYTAR